MKTLVLLAVAASLCRPALSQSVLNLINYQGKLTDQSGKPLVAGIYGIQFRLWDSGSTNGSNDLIWGQQQNATVQSNGVFNVILEAPGGTPIGGATPAVTNLAYAFSGSNRFLGVTIVMSNGTALTSPSEIVPRQQLLSVPFALVSASAASVVPNAIGSQQIAQGAVTITNLAPHQIGTNVGLGGFAISPTNNDNIEVIGFSDTGTPIPHLSVTISCSGGPVEIFTCGGSIANNSLSYFGAYALSGDIYSGLGFVLIRDGVIIDQTQISGYENFTAQSSAYRAVDFPGPGVHTYSLSLNDYGGGVYAVRIRLAAHEY